MNPKDLPQMLAGLDDPAKAVELWSNKLSEGRRRRDDAAVHACLDVLVHLLLDVGRFELAEQYARELLEIEEDATHVMIMGKVCEATGRREEAQEHFLRASTLNETHLDARTRAIMEQAGVKVVGRPNK